MSDPTRDQLIQLRRNIVELESRLDRKGVQNLIERFDVVELIAEIDQAKLDAIRCLTNQAPKLFIPTVTIVIADPARPFLRDMAKESKWKLLSDVEYKAGTVICELAEFLKPEDNGSVKGDVMAERAKEIEANLGQKHAEYLLENQHLIPDEYKKFYLVFPGTVWGDSGRRRGVPCLGWDGERWCFFFNWLVHDWFSNFRLLRPRK